MKSPVLPASLLPLFLLFLTSCGNLSEPDLRGIENLRIGQLGGSESTLFFDMRCYNPNQARLKLKKAGGKAWLDGRFLGDFSVDSLVRIPSRDEFLLPVRLQVDMKGILKNSVKALLAKEVQLKIDGRARVGKGILFINYPLKYEGRQDFGKLIKGGEY